MRKVFVVSGSSHNFSAARKWGELVFLSNGPMNRYAVNTMYINFYAAMKHSSPEDYVLICGLAIMNSVAASVMTSLHGKVNYLLFKKGEYLERNIVVPKLTIDNN